MATEDRQPGVHAERRGMVLEVTLDRPKANAIDGATSRRMGEVFAGFRDDPGLRVAIVTGGRTWISASAASAACRNCPISPSRSSPRSTAWRSAAASSWRSRPT